MFFEADQISKNLVCPACTCEFDEPKTLPCGETVCTRCIEYNMPASSDSLSDDHDFKCFVCDEVHVMPRNGFKTNKLMQRLLATQPKEVFRSKWIDEFKKNLIFISERRIDLLLQLDNRLEIIRSYFDLKRTQIHLITESRIDEINKLKLELTEQVGKAEKVYLEAAGQNEATELVLREITTFTDQVDLFYSKWIKYLKQSFISEAEIQAANQECLQMDALLSMEALKAKQLIYNNNMFN